MRDEHHDGGGCYFEIMSVVRGSWCEKGGKGWRGARDHCLLGLLGDRVMILLLGWLVLDLLLGDPWLKEGPWLKELWRLNF